MSSRKNDDPIRLGDNPFTRNYILIKECGSIQLFQDTSKDTSSEYIMKFLSNDGDEIFLDNAEIGYLKEVLKEVEN